MIQTIEASCEDKFDRYVLSVLQSVRTSGCHVNQQIADSFSSEMLGDSRFGMIHSMIAETLVKKQSEALLDKLNQYNQAGRILPAVMLGISFATRTCGIPNDYNVKLFRCLLSLSKNPKITSWFKVMLFMNDYNDMTQSYVSGFPLSLAEEVFKDDWLKFYYPQVFQSNYYNLSDDDEDVRRFLDVVESYFNRNLTEDVYLHIAVFEAVWNVVSHKCHRWSKGNEARLYQIFKDVCRRGVPELEAHIELFLELSKE